MKHVFSREQFKKKLNIINYVEKFLYFCPSVRFSHSSWEFHIFPTAEDMKKLCSLAFVQWNNIFVVIRDQITPYMFAFCVNYH